MSRPHASRRRRVIAVLAMFLSLNSAQLVRSDRAGAATCPAGRYRPPVNAPVTDGFHVDAGPYGPGNRGVDYDVANGSPVGSIGAGVVAFAGDVAGQLYVTVLHHDGLRSSYGPLADIAVKRGQSLAQGAAVGLSKTRLHLGVRRGRVYLDPAQLFAGPLRLIPDAAFGRATASTTARSCATRG